MRISAVTNKGLVRNSNQDFIGYRTMKEAAFFLLADGMGGHSRGEYASSFVIQSLLHWWDRYAVHFGKLPMQQWIERISVQLQGIHEKLYEQFKEKGTVGGTTLCILLLLEEGYAVLSIGDSRVYRFLGNKCMQLTMDQIWENMPDVRKSMSEQEIVNHPNCGKLVQAIGAQKNLNIVTRTGLHEGRGAFLLCTDGIFKMIPEERMKKILSPLNRMFSREEVLKKLEAEVRMAGAQDNYSAIFLEL